MNKYKSTSSLFEPFKQGNLTLKNRLVMAPMTRKSSPNGILNNASIDYYSLRALGGVGLIISEGTCINNSAHGYAKTPSFYGKEAIKAWKALVKSIHKYDGKIIPQLWHVGSVRQENLGPVVGSPSVAPSPIMHPYLQHKPDLFPTPCIPRPMTIESIEKTIDDFTRAAALAQQIGCDGIELHGAHGYLIDQFFWNKTNTRTDTYGGSILSRTRFACELVKSIKKVAPNFPLILRISQWKLGDFSAKNAENPKELEQQLIPLIEAGVDIFHCSTHRFNEPEFKKSKLSYAGWVKKIASLPVIAAGGIALDNPFTSSFAKETSNNYPLESVLEALERKEFDLAAIGRPLLADPYWPSKIKALKYEEIIPFSPHHLP